MTQSEETTLSTNYNTNNNRQVFQVKDQTELIQKYLEGPKAAVRLNNPGAAQGLRSYEKYSLTKEKRVRNQYSETIASSNQPVGAGGGSGPYYSQGNR